MKIGDIIVVVMLAVPVLRYSVAFQQAEPVLVTPWGNLDISYITGLAFGISYEAAMYFGLREGAAAKARSNKTTWFLPMVAACLQAIVGVAIIVPVLVADLQARTLGVLLGDVGSWLWSFVVALASLLCFVTVSLGLVVEKKGTTSQQEKTNPKRGKTNPKQEETSIKQEATSYEQEGFVCQYPGCNFVAKTQLGLNAHQRMHKGQGKKDDF